MTGQTIRTLSCLPASDAKARFSELLERTRQGEEFVITLHGHETARLLPIARAGSGSVGEMLGQLRQLRVGVRLNPTTRDSKDSAATERLTLTSLIADGRK